MGPRRICAAFAILPELARSTGALEGQAMSISTTELGCFKQVLATRVTECAL